MQVVPTFDGFAGQPSEHYSTAMSTGLQRSSVSAQSSTETRLLTPVGNQGCVAADISDTGITNCKSPPASEAAAVTNGSAPTNSPACEISTYPSFGQRRGPGMPPKPTPIPGTTQPGSERRDDADGSTLSESDTRASPEPPLTSSLPPVTSPAESPSTPHLSYEQRDAEHIRVQFSSTAMLGIRSLPDALAPHFRERLFAELLSIGKLRHDRQQQQMRQHGGGTGRAGRHAAALAPLLAHGSKAGPLHVPVRSSHSLWHISTLIRGGVSVSPSWDHGDISCLPSLYAHQSSLPVSQRSSLFTSRSRSSIHARWFLRGSRFLCMIEQP